MSDIIKRDLPDAHISVVEDLSRLIKHVNNHQCAEVTDKGIIIRGGAHINSWRSLVRDLYSCWQAGEIRGILVKFMVGDALNQGVDIYGEDSWQIYADIPWKKRYIENICWVCRKVPPENRRLQLNWLIHQSLAPLPVDEQRYYIASAVHKFTDGNEDWYKLTMKELHESKCREMLSGMEPDDKDRWLQIMEQYNPTWNKLQQWIKGELPAPVLQNDVSVWIGNRVADVAAKIGVKSDETEILRSLLFDLYDGIKNKTIR